MSNVADYSENNVVGDMPIGFRNIEAIVPLTNEVSIESWRQKLYRLGEPCKGMYLN